MMIFADDTINDLKHLLLPTSAFRVRSVKVCSPNTQHNDLGFPLDGRITTFAAVPSTKDANLLVVKLPNFRTGQISLTGKTFSGKEFSFTCPWTDAIGALKEMIDKLAGIPSDQQRLIFSGKQLEDGRFLEDYGMLDEGFMHLISRLRGGADIRTGAQSQQA